MKHILLTMLICLLALPATCPAQNATRHEVHVGDFSTLRLLGDVNVDYRCCPDSAGTAVINGSKTKASLLMFSNNTKGTLTVQLTTDAIGVHGLPSVTVYSSSLKKAENGGDSTLTIAGLPHIDELMLVLADNGKIGARGIDADKLQLRIITGHGTITATGRCDDLAARIVGIGTIDAESLAAHDVNCKLVGTGTVRCRVDGGQLSVKGSGSGKVYYHGSPDRVRVRQLGSIRAVALDQ